MSPNLKLLLVPALVALLLLMASMAAATYNSGNPSGSSVNIISGLNETFFLHCSSKDSDFNQVSVGPHGNYYWKFNPNVFGRTVYNCEFNWGKKTQDFPVWQGSDYSDRPICCDQGPCMYKVSSDGIYNAVSTDTDGNGIGNEGAEWTFFKPWLVISPA